jgi:RHS repeat-associated protein
VPVGHQFFDIEIRARALGARTMRGQAARACDEPPASEGLKYSNARWYDPQSGRFISEDPARDGVNWYAYVNNNPMRYMDPRGLFPVDYVAEMAQRAQSGDASAAQVVAAYTSGTATRGTPTAEEVVQRAVDPVAEFERYRAEYKREYHDPRYDSTHPLREYGIGTGPTYPDGRKHPTIGPDSAAQDYTARLDEPVYTTSDQTFDIDEGNPYGMYPSRWSYGDDSYSPTKTWPDIVTQGKNFGYFTKARDDKGTYVYAHQNPNAAVAKAFNVLQQKAHKAGLTSFSLPKGTQIGTVGLTGETNGPRNGPHLHYEYPR